MSNKLYLECYSGISGDMMVAALLDLGADKNILDEALKSLDITGFQIEISRVLKSGIDACDFKVILDFNHENHDHDIRYLHGYINGYTYKEEKYRCKDGHYEHGEKESLDEEIIDKGKQYGYGYKQCGHVSNHEYRSIKEINTIINNSNITSNAKRIAKDIFTILAKAEAKAHGVDVEDVHFHEIGAVDSIVDIVATAVCLDNLNITEVIVPVLYEGRGFIRCQHGVIPIPVPAVSNIVSDNGLNLHLTTSEGEFVTPTGAAIVASIITSSNLPENFSIKKIGIGAGKRNYDRPSILRAMIIEENSIDGDYIYKLESNIDDCTGEALGFVMERLFEAGARDVYYTPVYMKKNRPAYQLNVICKREDIEKLEEIIFKETTTIGIRRQSMERSVLKRELIKVQTTLGEAQIKVCQLPSGKRYYPEYSSVKELCKNSGLSYQEVYHLIKREVK